MIIYKVNQEIFALKADAISYIKSNRFDPNMWEKLTITNREELVSFALTFKDEIIENTKPISPVIEDEIFRPSCVPKFLHDD